MIPRLAAEGSREVPASGGVGSEGSLTITRVFDQHLTLQHLASFRELDRLLLLEYLTSI